MEFLYLRPFRRIRYSIDKLLQNVTLPKLKGILIWGENEAEEKGASEFLKRHADTLRDVYISIIPAKPRKNVLLKSLEKLKNLNKLEISFIAKRDDLIKKEDKIAYYEILSGILHMLKKLRSFQIMRISDLQSDEL